MRHVPPVCLLPLVLVLVCNVPALVTAAEEAAPASWQALPAETLVAVRVPDGGGLIEALRQRTKLGAVMLSQERCDRIGELIRQADPQAWALTVEGLEQRGLSTKDLFQLLSGETAFALLAEARPDRAPLMVALGWVTPGPDLAERLLNAVAGAVEDQAEAKNAVTRTDLKLGGHKVMHLVFPHVTQPPGADQVRWEMGPDGKPVMIEPDQGAPDTEARVTDQIHLLIARLGGRLVLAATFPQSGNEAMPLLEADEEVDFDALTGIEQATGVFARFLAAHGGDGGTFVDRIMAAPGLAAVLPDGDVALEMLGDFGAVYKLLAAYDDEALQQALEVIQALGLDRLGAAAYCLALDESLLRTGTFLAVPAPRQGLAGLLDQPALAPDPPVWVPADIMVYTQGSADLGAIYARIKETVIAAFPDAAAMQYDMIEQTALNFLQTDPATLLGSLGHRHVMLSFVPTVKKLQLPGREVEMPASRMAFVWEVTDEALWQRMIPALAASPMLQGAFELVEEQGFTGLRSQQEALDAAIFLGKGHLVLALGPDVAERVLTALSHPPAGDAAFGNGKVMARVRQVERLEPGLMFQAGDMAIYFEKVMPLLLNTFKMMGMTGFPGGAQTARLVQGLEEVLPSEQEAKGLMGVTGGDLFVNEHGLAGRSFAELPPPDDQADQ